MTYNAGYVKAMAHVAEVLAAEGEELNAIARSFNVFTGDTSDELRVRILEQLTKKRPDRIDDQGAAEIRVEVRSDW